MNTCKQCGKTRFDFFGSGLWSCIGCGCTRFLGFDVDQELWSPNEKLQPRSNYTRRKRFRKYLNRACRIQSSNTVPDATWEYLFRKGPYHGPRDVVHTLKKSRLKRKCYDSLPLLVHHLCPNLVVPVLSEMERKQAIKLFGEIDDKLTARPLQPFCSYLYVLEYIFYALGRSDMVPYCSRIQCRKRREKYRLLLNGVCNHTAVPPVMFTY